MEVNEYPVLHATSVGCSPSSTQRSTMRSLTSYDGANARIKPDAFTRTAGFPAAMFFGRYPNHRYTVATHGPGDSRTAIAGEWPRTYSITRCLNFDGYAIRLEW